mmetsp:Transcript_17717/g.44243  ORF Transcript_17717/g.44243 Transcript_17717/m.44243 type:complete len:243 (-) Transcript_17717:1837-2565(-)
MIIFDFRLRVRDLKITPAIGRRFLTRKNRNNRRTRMKRMMKIICRGAHWRAPTNGQRSAAARRNSPTATSIISPTAMWTRNCRKIRRTWWSCQLLSLVPAEEAITSGGAASRAKTTTKTTASTRARASRAARTATVKVHLRLSSATTAVLRSGTRSLGSRRQTGSRRPWSGLRRIRPRARTRTRRMSRAPTTARRCSRSWTPNSSRPTPSCCLSRGRKSRPAAPPPPREHPQEHLQWTPRPS